MLVITIGMEPTNGGGINDIILMEIMNDGKSMQFVVWMKWMAYVIA